ncbi:uncharacterized protein [Amphiura filiformis]|uniref:uncharacterized protein n=1 Tax=Amphiura filiformis TaxID=82378 RepID=UPI003B21A751
MSEEESGPSQGAKSKPTGSTQEFAGLLDNFKSYFEGKLDSFRKEITDQSSLTREKVEKLQTPEPEFNYKSNKKQWRFNTEVGDKVEEASVFLEKNKVGEAKEVLKQAAASIKHRNKLIRLADKSDGGWLAVEEYEEDDLASDSEDDKRIRSAQNRGAARKERQIRQKSDSSKRRAQDPNFKSNMAATSTDFFRGSNQFNRRSFGIGFSPQSSGNCFGCGRPGHFRANCPFKRPSGTPPPPTGPPVINH